MFLVSKCCAGMKCRYRRTGYLKKSLERLGEAEDYLAVCPEMLGGLPLPREGCDVKRGDRVIGRKTGTDYTAEYLRGAYKTLELCRKLGIDRAYLLRSSPSCGKGYGITAKVLAARGIKVIAI